MKTRKNIPNIFFVMFTTLAFALISLDCASGAKIQPVSYELRATTEADSLFRTGNYELAKIQYVRLRDNSKNQTITSRAQYNLGYINIYYDNPFADYEAALREFKIFVNRFPNDDRAELAKNWIRILTAIQNYDSNFQGNVNLLKEIKSKQYSITKNYSSLQDAYLSCESRNDSLINSIKILEGVIEKLGKIQ